MVESVVLTSVMRNLEDMIKNEVELLGGVGERVKGVEAELRDIKCYLSDADNKRRKGEAQSKLVDNWLNRLRDVAYSIEDATDHFHLHLEEKLHKDPSLLDRLKKLGRYTFKAPGLHKLAIELSSIENELQHIFNSKDKYGIKPALQHEGSSEAVELPFRRAANEDVDETQVFGLETDKNNIVNLLLNTKIKRRAVITIVGTGGLGKTTLARSVYKM